MSRVRLNEGLGDSMEEPMFVVTTNNPYYPNVIYVGTIEEAQKERDDFLRSDSVEDGKYEAKVTIAEVIETTEIRTYY